MQLSCLAYGFQRTIPQHLRLSHRRAGLACVDAVERVLGLRGGARQSQDNHIDNLTANGIKRPCSEPCQQPPTRILEQVLALLPVAGQEQPVLRHDDLGHTAAFRQGKL